MFKKIFTLLLFVSLFSCKAQNDKKAVIIDINQLKETVIGKEVQLIDLRTDKEYKAGFIDDAIQMNFSDIEKFMKQINTLNKNKPIYIYCQSGGRSGRAAKILIDEGFSKVYNFSGGWKQWKEQ